MGQAKNRGNRDERVKQGIEKKRLEKLRKEEEKALREASLTPEERKRQAESRHIANTWLTLGSLFSAQHLNR